VDPAWARCSLRAASPQQTGRSALALMPYWREAGGLLGQITGEKRQVLLPRAAREPAPAASFDGASVGTRPCKIACRRQTYGANDHHYFPAKSWNRWPLKSCRWGGRWSGKTRPFCIPLRRPGECGVDNAVDGRPSASAASHMPTAPPGLRR